MANEEKINIAFNVKEQNSEYKRVLDLSNNDEKKDRILQNLKILLTELYNFYPYEGILKNRTVTEREKDIYATIRDDANASAIKNHNSYKWPDEATTPTDEAAISLKKDRIIKVRQEIMGIVNKYLELIEKEKIDLKYQWVKVQDHVKVQRKLAANNSIIAEDVNNMEDPSKNRYVGNGKITIPRFVGATLLYDKLGATREGQEINLGGKIGLIEKIYQENEGGPWYFKLWIEEPSGNRVNVYFNDTNKPTGILKYTDVSTNDIRKQFATVNIEVQYISLFANHKFNINEETNISPENDSVNPVRISVYYKNLKGVSRDTIQLLTDTAKVKRVVNRVDKNVSYMLSREVRTKYKKYIQDILQDESFLFTNNKYSDLLAKKIRFGNNKQKISSILISKISYILSQGQSIFNPYNTQKMKKEYEGEEDEDGTGKGKVKGKGIGGGSNLMNGGSRDFSKDDTTNFIIFILENLLEIQGIEEKDDKLRDVLLQTYLTILFSKIGSRQLAALLVHIEISKEVSKNVIGHFKKKLKDTPQAKDSKSDKDTDYAKEISKLGLNLTHNMQSFIRTIIDITLNVGELQEFQGNTNKISNYLDDNFNKAMNIPSSDEKKRIENFELSRSLKDLFNDSTESIPGYRDQIKKLDKIIDDITDENNVYKQITEISKIIKFLTFDNDKIIYTIPEAIKDYMTEPSKKGTDETSKTGSDTDIKSLISSLDSSKGDDDILRIIQDWRAKKKSIKPVQAADAVITGPVIGLPVS